LVAAEGGGCYTSLGILFYGAVVRVCAFFFFSSLD
jgi:hypothetical protein